MSSKMKWRESWTSTENNMSIQEFDTKGFVNLVLQTESLQLHSLFNEKVNDAAVANCWPSILLLLLPRIGKSKCFLLNFLLNYSVDRIVRINQNVSGNMEEFLKAKNLLAGGLKSILMKGFQLLQDSKDLYIAWLEELQPLFQNQSLIADYEVVNANEPGSLSYIGAICMISYIERFISLSESDPEFNQRAAPLENQLVQLSAAANQETIIFPLAYISSHIIDIASGPSHFRRDFNEVAIFLTSYFGIDHNAIVESATKASNLNISVEAMDEWRKTLLFDSSHLGTALSRNILFVDGIFTEKCGVSFVSPGFFNKSSAVTHSNIEWHMDYIVTVSKSIGKDNYTLLYKCLFYLDSFCNFNKPSCCSRTTGAKSLMGIQRLLGLETSVTYVVLSIIDMKNSLPTDRLINIMTSFEEFFLSLIDSQESIIQIVNCLKIDATSASLLKDYETFPEYYPVLDIIFNCLQNSDKVPFSSDLNSKMGITWITLLPSFASSLLLVKGWQLLSIPSVTRTEIGKRRYLEAMETILETAPLQQKEAFQSAFQVMIKTFNAPVLPHYLSGSQESDVRLAFFQLVKLSQSDKRHFFRISLEILYFYECLRNEDSVVAEDLEEGEEGEAAIARWDDVQGAFQLFHSQITTIYPKYPSLLEMLKNSYLGESPLAVPTTDFKNILLLPELSVSNKSISQSEAILDVTCAIWTALAISVPYNAFKQSLRDVCNQTFLTTSQEAPLYCFTYVYFILNNAWALKDSWNTILTLALHYNPNKGPFYAFSGFLMDLNSLKFTKDSIPFSFLRDLTKECAVKLAPITTPALKWKSNPKSIKNYLGYEDFLKSNDFPIGTLSFLADLVGSLNSDNMNLYFEYLLHEMKVKHNRNNSYGPFELVLVSLVALKRESNLDLVDSAIKHIILEEVQGELRLDLKFSKFFYFQFLVQSYLNDPINISRPVGAFIQSAILKTRFQSNQEAFRMALTTFINPIPPTQVRDIWLSPIVENALSNPDNFAGKLLSMFVSTHHLNYTINGDTFSHLLTLLDSNMANPHTLFYVRGWEKHLLEMNVGTLFQLLSLFSEKLSVPLQVMLANYAMKSVRENVTGIQSIINNAIQSKSSLWLNYLVKFIFQKDNKVADRGLFVKRFSKALALVFASLCVGLPSSNMEEQAGSLRLLISSCKYWLESGSPAFIPVIGQVSIIFSVTETLRSEHNVNVKSPILRNLALLFNKLKLYPEDSEEFDKLKLLNEIDSFWSVKLPVLYDSCKSSVSVSLSSLFFNQCRTICKLLYPDSSITSASYRFSDTFTELARKYPLDKQWLSVLVLCKPMKTLPADLKLWTSMNSSYSHANTPASGVTLLLGDGGGVNGGLGATSAELIELISKYVSLVFPESEKDTGKKYYLDILILKELFKCLQITSLSSSVLSVMKKIPAQVLLRECEIFDLINQLSKCLQNPLLAEDVNSLLRSLQK